MKVFYESDDGIRFETKEECLAYENRYKNFSYIIGWKTNSNKYAEAFDYKYGLPSMEKIVFTDYKNVGEALNNYPIIYVPDEIALNITDGIGEEEAIITDGIQIGLNFWNDGESCWVQSDYYRERLQEVLQSLNDFDNTANFSI